jgi:hypothetical protein
MMRLRGEARPRGLGHPARGADLARGRRRRARAQRIARRRRIGVVRRGRRSVLPLTAYDAVLMRQDPPFDFEYVAATWLLERAESRRARASGTSRVDPRPFRKSRHRRVPAIHADHADRPRPGRHPRLHRRTRRRDPQAARRHGRQQHLPRHEGRPQPQCHRRDADRRSARAASWRSATCRPSATATSASC